MLFGFVGQKARHLLWVYPAILGEVESTRDAIERHLGPMLSHGFGPQNFQLQPNPPCFADPKAQKLIVIIAPGDANAARWIPATGVADLTVEAIVHLHAVHAQLDDIHGSVVDRDQPSGMLRRARGDVVLFQHNDIFDAFLRQMIGDAATGDTGADHHDSSLPRQ